MRSRMKRCISCRSYTLLDQCPICGSPVENTFPPRYSPDDKYGKYRRMALFGKDKDDENEVP